MGILKHVPHGQHYTPGSLPCPWSPWPAPELWTHSTNKMTVMRINRSRSWSRKKHLAGKHSSQGGRRNVTCATQPTSHQRSTYMPWGPRSKLRPPERSLAPDGRSEPESSPISTLKSPVGCSTWCLRIYSHCNMCMSAKNTREIDKCYARSVGIEGNSAHSQEIDYTLRQSRPILAI